MKPFLPIPKQNHSIRIQFLFLLLAALVLFACGVMAQAPAVSYSGSHGYATGKPITALSPANSGGTVAIDFNSTVQPVSFAYGGTQQIGQSMAVDNAGNIYVSDIARGGEILEYTGGQVIEVADGFGSIPGLAVDNAGNLFWTSRTALYKMTPGGTPTVIANFNEADGMAVDGAGNLYVADQGNFTTDPGGVYKLANDGSNKTKIDNGMQIPRLVAADPAGNVFAYYSAGGVYKIPAGSTQPTLLSSYQNVSALSADRNGNLYVGVAENIQFSSGVNNNVYFISAAGIASGSISPQFVKNVGLTNLNSVFGVIGAGGNLYIGYTNGSHLDEVDMYSRTGGYSVSPALPAGLILDENTGIISGTPTTVSPVATYTITALNGAGTNTANLTIQTGPAPVMSYGAAQAYNQGTTISPINPTNTGAAVWAPGYGAAAVLVIPSLNTPAGVAADTAGNVYVADKGNNAVKMQSPSGGNPVVVGSGLSAPAGLVTDAAGNVYVADSGNGAIKEIPAGNGAVQTLAGGLTAPQFVARDTTGNLFVANTTTIYKIAVGQSAATTVASGFTGLSGIAIDGSGNLYTTSQVTGKVYKIRAGTTAVLDMGLAFSTPVGIAADAAGNLFVTDNSNHTLYEVAGGNTAPVALSTQFSTSGGVNVGADGRIYVSDTGAGQVLELTPTGGFYINEQLPDGLAFNATTGVINGTTVSYTPATSYIITAYAGIVSGRAAISIAVNAIQAAPSLTYSAPADYVVGVPIVPLYPANAGGAVDPSISYNNTPAVSGTGIVPSGKIVYGFNSTIFVADKTNGSVDQIFTNGSSNQYVTSLYQPNGIAVDNIGYIWVADNKNVRQTPYGAGNFAYIVDAGSFQVPASIAADAHGNIYVGDLGLGGIYRMKNDGTGIVKIDQGITHPDALASDAAGNLYAVSSTANALYKIPADGSAQVTMATFTQPTDVTLDAQGDIFVSTGDGHIYAIPTSGGAPALIRQGTFANISGLTLDASGNLYVGQSTSAGVSKLTPTAGYISNVLPAGFAVDRTTGVISGTPTAGIPGGQWIYVTGYNAYGSSIGQVYVTTVDPPAISYATPTTFYKGVGASLSPQNTGTPITFRLQYTSQSPQVLAAGFNSPKGVAVDNAGNIFVADQGNNVVKELPAQGGAPIIAGSGFNNPTGLVVDNAGNVYVADSGNGVIKEIPATGSIISVIGPGFIQPWGLAIDQAGNLYVSDRGDQAIYKLAAGTRAKSLVINTGLPLVGGLAIDGNGTLFITDASANNSTVVYKLPAGSNTLLNATPGVGFSSLVNVATDTYNNLYILYFDGQGIWEQDAAGRQESNGVGFGSKHLWGLTVDGQGSIIATSGSDNKLYRIQPVYGYYSNKILPAGISLNSTNGTISGTPAAVSPATDYQITGWANNVASTAPLNLGVAIPSADATLANLAVDGNTISPGFDPSVLSYNATVNYIAASVTVTPTVNNFGATVTVNGQAVTSGTSSQSLPLAYGNNTATVVVTAQDQVTKKTYTININRQLAPETITFNALASPTYGDADLAPGATSDNSGVQITYSSDNAAVATIVNGNIHIIGAGTANITASQAGDAIHNPAPDAIQQLTVNPANLNIKLDNQTSVYGGAVPALTAQYLGLVNGDNASSLSTAPTLSTTGTSSSPAGTYPITATGAVDANYNISYTAGTLTIGQANLIITADDQQATYGGTVPTLTASYSGFVNNDNASNLTTAPSLSTTGTSSSPVNTYPINISGAADPNYIISYTPGTLTIGQANLTITADDKNSIYGGSIPALTISYSGFVNNDDVSILTSPPTISTIARSFSHAGTYPINLGTTSAGPNYNIIYKTGTLTIGPANLTITADNKNTDFYYGFAPSASYRGFVNGDDHFDLTTQPTLTTTRVLSSPVGTYPITASGAADPDYNITYVDGTLTVKPEPITIITDNIYANYGGTSFPAPSFFYSGFVNGEDQSALAAAPVMTTPATPSSPAGTYPMTVNLADPNFNVTYINGQVYIQQANLTITADDKTMIAGQPVPALTVTYSGFIPGEGPANLTTLPAISTDATSSSSPGSYSITPGGAVDPNYNIQYVPAAMTVKGSPNALLSNISLSAGILSPAFDPNVHSYNITVPASTGTITLTGTIESPYATINYVFGGGPGAPYNLAYGSNQLFLQVRAQDGQTLSDYFVYVNRPYSTNAYLGYLTVRGAPLSPAFNYKTFNYSSHVPYKTQSVTVVPTLVDNTAKVYVNNTQVANKGQLDVALHVGANTIQVVTIAQDNRTRQVYTDVVIRDLSDNAALASMNPSVGPLSPVFSPVKTNYTLNVPNNKATITVSPIVAQDGATTTVNGNPVASGGTSPAIPLTAGVATSVSVVVTAPNGTTTNTYTIIATRALSGNASLSAMGPQYGPLNPVFQAGVTNYTLSVANSKSTMTVTPVAADPNSAITVNGKALSSGAISDPVALTTGTATPITVVVTAQDGTTQTYTINVTRLLSDDATLSAMGPQYGPLSPVFQPGTTGYTINVANSKSTFTVKPVANDPQATLTVNGVALTSGSTSDPIALTAGASTNISVAVTAQDGTINTYIIAVNRAPGGNDSYQDISVTKPAETVTMAEDGIKVHQGVSPNGDGIDDVLQIDNISQYPDNHLKIMNRNGELVFEVKGYDNTSKVFDGRSSKNGRLQLPGTYFFQLDYNVNGTTKTRTGYLVLKY